MEMLLPERECEAYAPGRGGWWWRAKRPLGVRERVGLGVRGEFGMIVPIALVDS
jgi:hypothetical protein